eukprot:Skav204667  [mRNA]  locus=scaffold607:120038:122932:- [translate_table: standard]
MTIHGHGNRTQDPLGFTKTDDALSFRRRRYVELKHGRVAMFACLGYIAPWQRSSGGGRWAQPSPKHSRVSHLTAPRLPVELRTRAPAPELRTRGKVPLSGWAQIVAFAGTVELFQYVAWHRNGDAPAKRGTTAVAKGS